MRQRRRICGWCARTVCITSVEDLFYTHFYRRVLTYEKVKCPHSGKDSNKFGRHP